MNCPSCEADNAAEAHYCASCGSALSTGRSETEFQPFRESGTATGETAPVARSGLLERMIGAARLDPRIYEEVEADTGATLQAMLVVIMVSVATGIGALGAGGIGGLLFGVIFGLAGWAVWALITYLVGTTWFRTPETHADWGQLARTTGFAQSPGVLRVLGFIPVVGPVIVLFVFIWQIAAMAVAVRQALDYRSTWRAVGVVLVGFIVLVIPLILFAILLASGGTPP